MNHLPLRIAILWHFHQPDYRVDNRSQLPWVRLHAIKDYSELPALHREYPTLRITYNISPILLEQLSQYSTGQLRDEHGEFSRLNRSTLKSHEKAALLRWAFVGNVERMIVPFQRYHQLYEQFQHGIWHKWNENDWIDLQVWMRLAWFGGIERKSRCIERLLHQERHFSHDDLAALISIENELLIAVPIRLASLVSTQLAEITVCPYYHPILPLLCDRSIAQQNVPTLSMREKIFQYPQDARAHVERALRRAQQWLGSVPSGMWMSEGAVSDDALAIVSDYGILWTATDQIILKRTLNSDEPLLHYQPYLWSSHTGKPLVVFFRDHTLSDMIGFVYSKWDPQEAAADLISRLESLRLQLVERFGEDFLHKAVVSIILDGENCWEHYVDNGIPFLRALYDRLASHSLLKTTTFTDAALYAINHHETPRLQHVVPGSWIDGDFRIWTCSPAHTVAWTLLHQVRECCDNQSVNLPEEAFTRAYEHILIAEGSDWFWWLYPQHQASFQEVFDVLYRYHIAQAYKHMGIVPPPLLSEPLMPIATEDTVFDAMHPVTVTKEFRHGG